MQFGDDPPSTGNHTEKEDIIVDSAIVDFGGSNDEPDERTPAVMLNLGGFEFVPVSEVLDAAPQLSESPAGAYRLKAPATVDVLTTSRGPLLWEYSDDQLYMLVDLADWLAVRAYDVAAFIAHSFCPELGVLDSEGQAITTLEALPENSLGVDQFDAHVGGGSPLSVVPADAARPGLPTTGPVESVRYLFRRELDGTDEYGVRVDFHEDPACADAVITSLPRNLPHRFQEQFAPLMVQRVEYTLDDRRSDRRWGGEPSKWSQASGFAHGLDAAIGIAHAAVTQAVFAHAKGEEWVRTLQPYCRAGQA